MAGRRRGLILLGAALAVAVGALHVFRPSFIASLDSLAYDTLLRSVARRETGGAVLIVDIDERSLGLLGQWPWPRHRIAALLQQLTSSGASSVGLDVVFAEPDRSSPHQIQERLLRELKTRVLFQGLPPEFYDQDWLLAETLARGPHVLGYQLLYGGVERSSADCLLHPLSAAVRMRPGTSDSPTPFSEASGVVCPLGSLAQAAGTSGFFNAVPDPDGRLRRIPLLARYQGRLYPSLALATVLRARGLREVVVTVNESGVESLQAGGHTVPLDARGNVLLNYRGPRGMFPTISAADLLSGRVPPEVVRGKIVLVGSSAAGLHELRATPFDAAFAGVEVHATAIDNLLRGDFLRSPGYSPGLELGLVVLCGLAASLLFAGSGAAMSLAILAAGGLLLWSGSHWLLASHRLFVSPVSPGLVLAVEFSGLSLMKFWRAERAARQRTRELLLTQDAAIQSLAALAEVRDMETGGHILRTRRYIEALARQLSHHRRIGEHLDEATIEAMHKMAPLHDVGKIGIPDAILLKPGRLSAEEFEGMKRHTVLGHQIFRTAEARLGSNSFLRLADQLAYSHHERWDGTGYPQGLQAEAIPLAGRIMAVVDVYDALVSHRPYKAPLTHEAAVTIIQAGRATQFDPEVVDAFLAIAADFQRISQECADPEHRDRMQERDGVVWDPPGGGRASA